MFSSFRYLMPLLKTLRLEASARNGQEWERNISRMLIRSQCLVSLNVVTVWASYQIRKIVDCACAGNAGNCGGQNVPGIPGACTTRNCEYLVRGPWSHCSTASFLKWIPTNNSAWPFVSSKSDWCSCFVSNVISMGPGGNGSVQRRRNSNALSTELRLSCTKPSIWTIWLYCAVCEQKPTMLAHIFHYCRYYITVAPSHYHHYSGLFGSFEQVKSLSGIFSRVWV